jgi:adenylate cyclase class 2
MATKADREIEAKFLVRDLSLIEARVVELGAELVSPRVFETNLRFDTPGRELAATKRALRLRRDHEVRLTYKGPPNPRAEVQERQEIEFGVGDFAAARRLLIALGYEVSAIYEKYRTTYRWREVEIVLDELPCGSFIEIEGPGAGAIRCAAEELGLRWEARSGESYLALFDRLRAGGLKAIGLTFEELGGIRVTPLEMGLNYAD